AGRQGAMERSFGTTCHGAGRRMSRTAARKEIGGAELRRRLEADGITVRCPSARGLAEEAPFAYKDVARVVEIVERAGLAARVAEREPRGGSQQRPTRPAHGPGAAGEEEQGAGADGRGLEGDHRLHRVPRARSAGTRRGRREQREADGAERQAEPLPHADANA